MLTLTLGLLRELVGRWWLPAFALALLTAASLSFDPSLGSHSLGTYLAYVSMLPLVILFRCGWLLEKRVREGWRDEEILRDPKGRRAPLAEFLACIICTGVVLTAALVPPLLPMFTLPQGSSGLYPVRVQVTDQGAWLFDLGGRVPEGARLHLTLDWSYASMVPEEVRIEAPDQRQVQPIPGQLLHWDLSPEEAYYGKLVLQPSPGSGVELRTPLCRLEIRRPSAHDLPRLLWFQFLFFLPLFAMLLAWHRCGRVRGGLSALVSFTIGSLAAMQIHPMDLGGGPIAALAKMLLLLKLSLPPVEGLLATGQRYERLVGTVSISNILAWHAIGALALWLACRRRPPQSG